MGNTTRKIKVKTAPPVRLLSYIPEAYHERLRLQAFKEHKKMSAIVREALKAYFDKNPV